MLTVPQQCVAEKVSILALFVSRDPRVLLSLLWSLHSACLGRTNWYSVSGLSPRKQPITKFKGFHSVSPSGHPIRAQRLSVGLFPSQPSPHSFSNTRGQNPQILKSLLSCPYLEGTPLLSVYLIDPRAGQWRANAWHVLTGCHSIF